MYVDVGLIGVVVNLVDLFNFARECERNKFNYKVGDFRKIDFLGRLLQKQGISKVIFVFTYIQFNLCPALWPNDNPCGGTVLTPNCLMVPLCLLINLKMVKECFQNSFVCQQSRIEN